jgi:hypothetical protein
VASHSDPIRPSRRPRLAALIVIAVLLVAGAAAAVAFGASRGANGGCRDEKRPGLDPALEALVPPSLEGRPADHLDSSMTCSADGLGSLREHGVTSLLSAGGLWDLGPQTGVTLAVFRLPGPERADRVAEFYATSAASAPKVANLVTTHPSIGGSVATRLDFSDADFPQAIVVWPDPRPDVVDVVLAAGVPDRIVQEAIAAFEASR